MEIKRYYIPKLPRNKYKYSGSSSVYTGGSGDSVSYVYNKRVSNHLNGIAAGITYEPSFLPNLRLIAEYDNINYSVGASYLLFDQLHAQFLLQDMKYFTGGLCYKIHLK